MIDWSKLRSYQGNRWKSFEEFCYSIAKRLYYAQGKFTSIDDSGGGDGVEFYLTRAEGTEWGWQAKCFYPQPRLSKSGRKTSIKKSLKKAVKNHKRLKKWFLCTPTDFTTSEINWFEKLQEKYPNVILEHLGNSEFNDFLSNPLFLGIRNYYFGELELSIDWFRKQVEKQIAIIGDKFIPNLHTETYVDFQIHTLLNDSVFISHLKEQIISLEDFMVQLDESIEDIRKTVTIINWLDIKNKLLSYASQLRAIFIEILKIIQDCTSYLSIGQFEQVNQINWDSMESVLKERLDQYYRIVSDFQPELLEYKGTEKMREYSIQYIKEKIKAPFQIADNNVRGILATIGDIKKTNQYDLHIFGGGNIGKTHIMCHIAQDRISNNVPAIFLLGKHFTTDLPIQKQILNILDIPTSYSWQGFIQALQSAAEVYKIKIPIIIDALNEAQNVDKWERELPGLVFSLRKIPQVVLITTCRSNYRATIWRSSVPENSIETYGFGYELVEEAIEKYFDWYKLKGDLTLASLRQFSNPIFLRIFCESQNRERKIEKQIFLGEQTLLQVFEDYLTQCNAEVCLKLSRYSSTKIVHNALNKIGRELWNNNNRYLPLSVVVKLVDSKDIEDLDWVNSVTYFLLDEGLLINKDRINDKDVVFFTYDLLGGYIIAKALIVQLNLREIKVFIKSTKFETGLLNGSYVDRHPLHEDILRCLSLLFPKHFGKHLYELTDDQTAFKYSLHALFEMSPELIDDQSRELISKLFSHPENRRSLLTLAQSTILHVGHPLNIDFWDKLIFDLSMSERDLSWTEFIRQNTSYFYENIDKFESVCTESKELSAISQQRLLLAAKFFRWLLTSTVRQLRDASTRALYYYGRRFPEEFFELVLNTLSINDPYVFERMLAATYGVTMALRYDFNKSQFREKNLPLYAKKLYELMFKLDAPYSTTHILSRDYAKRVIDIALIHDPMILSSKEKLRIRPPFLDGGIRNWKESEDRDKGSYREGSMPVHDDFENYTMGRLVHNRANYDFNHSEYKKVRTNIFWRLYDLGYSHDSFKEVDKEIYQYNWGFGRASNGGKIDRYGKKYSWIAFYELAGFRKDNGFLAENYSQQSRISDADLDPSFPEPPQECEVIKMDYLGNRSLNVTEWIEKGGVPDLSSYLIVDKLCDTPGPWVLLEGHITQVDLQANRMRFILPRGLFVKENEASKISKYLKNQELRGRWLPDIPEDYYTYAGEIPWCSMFPYNGKSTLDFIIGSTTKRVTEKAVAKLRDGTVLTHQEFWILIIEKIKGMPSTEEYMSFLDKEGITEINTITYRNQKVNEEISFEVFTPIRYYNWESYHSIINRAGSCMVLAKEIAETLDLCSQPQTFDLYDKKGNRASITLRYGELYQTEHQLIFLRQDLLEHYLKEKHLQLIWRIWGERDFRSSDSKEMFNFRKKHKSRVVFQTITLYPKK